MKLESFDSIEFINEDEARLKAASIVENVQLLAQFMYDKYFTTDYQVKVVTIDNRDYLDVECFYHSTDEEYVPTKNDLDKIKLIIVNMVNEINRLKNK